MTCACYRNSASEPGVGNGETDPTHRPVLAAEVVGLLLPDPQGGGTILDATVGAGGHSGLLLAADPRLRVIGCDRDSRALRVAERNLHRFGERVRLLHGDFRHVLGRLNDLRLRGVLADLGVSSMQLEDPGAGFSFMRDGPLDMRMDGSQLKTAADLVNNLSAERLAEIIRSFGEEHKARRVAAAIVRARADAPLNSTVELADIVRRAVGYRGRTRIDPATRTFQALRIAVNEELEGLEGFVRDAAGALAPGGRLVIISFHSLEDRIVKNSLRSLAGRAPRDVRDPFRQDEPALLRLLTRRPLRPSAREEADNPRSRSARLRAAERRAPEAGK